MSTASNATIRKQYVRHANKPPEYNKFEPETAPHFIPATDPARLRQADVMQALLEMQSASAAELAARVGLDEATVTARLGRMREYGYLEPGKPYRLNDFGRTMARAGK